ncbi:hypothetical protein [Candidatus Solincola sp.]
MGNRSSALLASIVLCTVFLLASASNLLLVTISDGGAAVAASERNVADWVILGLDARDYVGRISPRIPHSERQWVRHHKVLMTWAKAEPRQDEFNWAYFDQEINARLADGTDSLMLLLTAATPEWARDPSYGSFADKAPPRDLHDWYDFCSRVAERYGSVVDFYEIWNEPGWDRDSSAWRNYGVYHFGGQVETDYLPLLQLGYQAIKEKDPSGIVVCGDLQCVNDPDPNKGTDLYALLFDDVNRPGQDVSVVVDAEQPIVAERPMYFNYNYSWDDGHDSLGATAPASVWYFAEGCTRPGFNTYLCLQNPDPTRKAQVIIEYYCGDGQTVQKTVEVGPRSRRTVAVHGDAEGIGVHNNPHGDVSIKVHSEVPIVAERPMYFNYAGMWAGGHDSLGATAPASVWYFAEGCTRPGFNTYLCLQNPDPTRKAQVIIEYYCGDGQTVQKTVEVGPRSRRTVAVHGDAEGIGVHNNPHGDVSIKVHSEVPIVAERPMYFNYAGSRRGGHVTMGTLSPQPQWYFAEGCTGFSIEEYLCLQNPQGDAVQVTVNFMMSKGETLKRTLTLSPHSRATLYLNHVIGFRGSCDMVTAHPYKLPPDWGRYYANVVNALRSRGVTKEVVVSEAGWPHYSDTEPGSFNEQQQAEAVGPVGVNSLLQNGCRKIWIYQMMDEDPGTSWDHIYCGLFRYDGTPCLAWNMYKQWQQTYFPDYPNLPASLP